jgi:tRNA G10  N-methylase Trm11
MLPPKLALMLFNLANIDQNETLLDPFCGSGTIVSEALLRGHKKIIATDLSEKAISDTKTNIAWLKNSRDALSVDAFKSEVVDVKKISEHVSPGTIDAVVTEPYLGKPLRGNELEDELKIQAADLSNLYFSAFSEFKKILRPGGRVVFIIPRFFHRSGSVLISDKLVPSIQKLGFTAQPLLPKEFSTQPFILYRRSDQRVGREIWKFTIS